MWSAVRPVMGEASFGKPDCKRGGLRGMEISGAIVVSVLPTAPMAEIKKSARFGILWRKRERNCLQNSLLRRAPKTANSEVFGILWTGFGILWRRAAPPNTLSRRTFGQAAKECQTVSIGCQRARVWHSMARGDEGREKACVIASI